MEYRIPREEYSRVLDSIVSDMFSEKRGETIIPLKIIKEVIKELNSKYSGIAQRGESISKIILDEAKNYLLEPKKYDKYEGQFTFNGSNFKYHSLEKRGVELIVGDYGSNMIGSMRCLLNNPNKKSVEI